MIGSFLSQLFIKNGDAAMVKMVGLVVLGIVIATYVPQIPATIKSII